MTIDPGDAIVTQRRLISRDVVTTPPFFEPLCMSEGAQSGRNSIVQIPQKSEASTNWKNLQDEVVLRAGNGLPLTVAWVTKQFEFKKP